ncbi:MULTISPECIES: phosphatase PAP2 family protein [Streptomyces]|uniref:Phosphatase PAP2 family protein n=1 Tax=Streptomyces dubilierae TaxID=3075533 RepID=A0ABU2P567_9ACTN|nr:phosphatase PAP2 family protein [Streptomyces sp. DSM 41921]MDT0386779.1 phosphatase PAP2 family protein [Streptomyces sp. DSM 41921]
MSDPTTTDENALRPLAGDGRPSGGPIRLLGAVMGDLRAVDGALYAAVAATPTPTLDRTLRHLSHAADHSKISFAIAAALALAGKRPRRAALAGVGAIAVASASANLLGKRLVRRARPDREAARVTVDRHVPMPTSASFPSGHTASAVAFATAVGVVLPPAAVPLGALAGAVGYSRIHTGVHYPGDVAAGAVLGIASAAAALAAAATTPSARTQALLAAARSWPRVRVAGLVRD